MPEQLVAQLWLVLGCHKGCITAANRVFLSAHQPGRAAGMLWLIFAATGESLVKDLPQD